MSNLSSILNPDGNRNRSPSTPDPEETVNSGGSKEKEVLSTRQRSAQSAYEHTPHPDCPDTLACLPDTDGRPQHTLPVILRCSILGSPRKRLTIREIYSAMEEKYPFYRTAGPTWKQSVRHHLSLNRLFERQPRPVTDPGFGSYWTVNLSAPPGTKRPRKRGRNNKESGASEEQNPAKSPTSDNTPIASTSTASISDTTSKPTRKRGRPRKVSVSSFNGDDTPMSSSHGDDDLDHSMDDPPNSDGEWEIRPTEVIRSPFGRRDSVAHQKHSYSHGRSPYPALHINTERDPPEVTIRHLRDEIGTLRRQSAEAVSVSLRLSEQLAQAQAEVLRSRNEIRELEEALEDEQIRRREAERLASEEAKMRRMVDDAQTAGPSMRSPDRSHASIMETVA